MLQAAPSPLHGALLQSIGERAAPARQPDGPTPAPLPPPPACIALHCRGENVVLLGELDAAREPPAGLQLVGEPEIKRAQKAEKEAEKMKGQMRGRFDFLLDDL